MNDAPQPDGRDDEVRAVPDQLEPPEHRSLAEDIEALYDDGRTYVEAEVAFQKSRAKFAGKRVRNGITFGVIAFSLFHLALIALTVGLIFALAPLVGPWIAVLIVVVTMMVGSVVLGLMALARFRKVKTAFKKDVR